jgi:hypothetical protein
MPTLQTLLPILLAVHGAMGAVDTLLNHELIERLPYRKSARGEIGLHAIREAIYGTLFIGLAWFEWHGAAAGIIAALLVAELIVTACDEFIENRTRVLPPNERILHVFLTLNLGLVIAVLVPLLVDWGSPPTQLEAHQYGILSWILSCFGAASFLWSVRDLVAWRRLS